MITVGGVAFSVILILVLTGLYKGWENQMTRFLGNIDATYWIGQKGSGDLSHGVSLIPTSLISQVENKPYIDSVSPFFDRQTSVSIKGDSVHIAVVGVDEKSYIRPYQIVEGSNRPKPGEIIIDITLARAQKLKIDDSITVAGKDLRITGISSGGNILAYTYALASTEDARTVFGSDNLINYLMVRTSDADAKNKLEQDFPDLLTLSKEEFLTNNKSIVTEAFLPLIEVLVFIGLLIGTAVIGLTIYTATVEKSREYGVLKAIGYTSGQLYGIALIQAVSAGLVGFVIGAILAPLISLAATYFASGFLYEVRPIEIAGIAGLTILMSLIASLLPLRRLFRIDPAQVFKA